jgi:mannose-6-phosphate isomerase-like protein (cupin superfamily)
MGSRSAMIADMSDPRTAPFAAIHLSEVTRLADVDPTAAADGGGAFHLVRRHFDVRGFGVNGGTGNAGDVVISEHDERDDTEYGTEGHEELFIVAGGHAVFTIDGEEVDAPTGTLVFVRDPALLRSARATVDGTAIVAVGARVGAPFTVSRWEQAVPAG